VSPADHVFRGQGWGPDRKPAAVSFTFDNMGEAAELEMGSWPANQEIGHHYSVRDVIPALLERLKGGPTATFFIEGWNTEIYPEAIRSIADAGHEIGLHGWRHEVWKKLDDAVQRSVISRGLVAMLSLGIEPKGFRPPGGDSTPLLRELMRAQGMSYFSDVGFGASVDNRLVRLPFAWRGVDGVFLEPELGKAVGVSGADETGIDALVRTFKATMLAAKETGDHVAFIFHPFVLGKDPARLDALFELIEFARSDSDLWVSSCGQAANWMLSTIS
jgi:peptidoglycan-N-acetylglucosamine deacetylase